MVRYERGHGAPFHSGSGRRHVVRQDHRVPVRAVGCRRSAAHVALLSCDCLIVTRNHASSRIVEELNIPWAVILSQDSFYKDLEGEDLERAERNEYNFDHPSTYRCYVSTFGVAPLLSNPYSGALGDSLV